MKKSDQTADVRASPMPRVVTAGVPMHVLDRTNGEKQMFSEEEIAALALNKPNAA